MAFKEGGNRVNRQPQQQGSGRRSSSQDVSTEIAPGSQNAVGEVLGGGGCDEWPTRVREAGSALSWSLAKASFM